jgi:hypothetical protein
LNHQFRPAGTRCKIGRQPCWSALADSPGAAAASFHADLNKPFSCACNIRERFDIPCSWLGPDGALLLAQLLAQFLPFLWRQRHFGLACFGGLALGLQGLAQLGPALLALGRPILRPGGLGDRLRQNRTRKAKEASKSDENLHSHKLTRWRGTLFTLLNGHSCKLSKFL